jgi:acyl-CoA thioesterase FadM
MMSLLFTTPLTVRFRDLDAMGHVNNAVFFTILKKEEKLSFLKSCQSPISLSFPLF